MADFEYEGFSGKFKLIFSFFDEISKFECLELHDASDGKRLEVFSLIQITEDILHVKRCLFSF